MPIQHQSLISAEQHPLFGIRQQKEQVEDIMSDLRGERYRDL